MFWEQVKPIVTPRLIDAVTRSYVVFEKYRLKGTIIHCDCPSCMSAQTARELTTLPLKEISATLLAEYTNSAHGYDRVSIEPEFKHFLPRYFDLIANCTPPSYLDLDPCLTRLQGYRDFWPTEEIEVVDEFFDAFVEASLQQRKILLWPAGYRLEFDMGEVLTMIVQAGGDLERVLRVLDCGPDPEVAVHMANLRQSMASPGGQAVYENPFLDDYQDAAMRIGAWLKRTEVTERIKVAKELLNDPDYDDILNAAVSSGS